MLYPLSYEGGDGAYRGANCSRLWFAPPGHASGWGRPGAGFAGMIDEVVRRRRLRFTWFGGDELRGVLPFRGS